MGMPKQLPAMSYRHGRAGGGEGKIVRVVGRLAFVIQHGSNPPDRLSAG